MTPCHHRDGEPGQPGSDERPRAAGDRRRGRRAAPRRARRAPAPGPTADRVKEALFAALGPDRLLGAVVLDCYAGSGALGDRGAVPGRGARAARRPRPARGRRDPPQPALDRPRRPGPVQRRGVGAVVRGRAAAGRPVRPGLLRPAVRPAGREARRRPRGARPSRAGSRRTARSWSSAPRRPARRCSRPGWGVTWSRVYGDTLVVLVAPAAEH